MRRRTLIGSLGVVGLVGCLGGEETDDEPQTPEATPTSTPDDTSAPTDSPTSTPTDAESAVDAEPAVDEELADRYESVVDVVAAGADPAGGELIDPVLQDVAADDTLLVVPAGEYRIDSTGLRGYANLGLVAESGSNPEFHPVSASQSVLAFDGGRDAHLEGIRFVQTDPDVGGTVRMNVAGDFVMRDIVKEGTHPRTEDDRGTAGFNVGVFDPDGTGVVERCSAPDGDNRSGRGAVGMFVHRNHTGTLYVRDCHLEGFTDNGLYGSAPSLDDGGPVHVEGGLYRNNNIAGVRVASAGCSIRDVTIVNDSSVSFDYATNQRGIWMPYPKDDITIENVDICQRVDDEDTAGDLGAGIVIGQPEAGGRVEDVRIRNDGDAPAIHLGGENPGWTGTDIHLTGDGDMTYPEAFENVCVGDDCDGPVDCA